MSKYKSLFDIWKKSGEQYFEFTAFLDSKNEINITYGQAFRLVCFLAEKFQSLGIERKDHVSLFAVNSPYWLILEQAVITIGGVVVSKSSEIILNELEYVFENSDSVALITDDRNILSHFVKQNGENKKLKFFLYMGREPIEKAENVYNFSDIIEELCEDTPVKTDWAEIPEDTAYINYTSGTSSYPKGAMLPNIGMSYVVEELQKFNNIKSGNTFIVTFPLSSAGGKSFNLLCLSQGCGIVYTKYKDFYDVTEKIQPDYFHIAPKIIQTMHSKFMEKVQNKKVFSVVYKISQFILDFEKKYFYKNKLLFLKPIIGCLKNFADKKVYKKIRNTMLKDDAVLYVGSAHLAKPLEDFLQIMNITHVQHYGLTETTGIDVSNTAESQKLHPYTVGIPFSSTVLKIINPETGEELPNGETGLITLQGPEILQKYYKNEEATKKAILDGHFLNTGDLGYIDRDGYLTVLSRYDDVVVLSNGYNVYIPLLENEAKDSEYVNQLIIAGHGKPYLSALIVLNKNAYENWCQNNSCNNDEPNKNEVFKKFLIEHLNDKIKRKNNHKYYEKLKKVYFLNEEFTFENGMLTATMKVKYRAVVKHYKQEIESLYKD